MQAFCNPFGVYLCCCRLELDAQVRGGKVRRLDCFLDSHVLEAVLDPAVIASGASHMDMPAIGGSLRDGRLIRPRPTTARSEYEQQHGPEAVSAQPHQA